MTKKSQVPKAHELILLRDGMLEYEYIRVADVVKLASIPKELQHIYVRLQTNGTDEQLI